MLSRRRFDPQCDGRDGGDYVTLNAVLSRLVLRVFSLLFVCLAALRAQTAGLEGNKSLFTVLAAMNAAGYDTDLASPTNHPLRAAIREEIARRKPASVPDLKDYFRRHRQDNPQAELRLYASWALLVTDPPAFDFKHRDHQLPPDVLNLRDLAPLMTRFYEEANIEDLWKRSQPAFEQFAVRYHEPASQAVTLVSAYLRSPLSGAFGGRKFQVVIDMLGPPNQILFLPFFDEYFLVVTNSVDVHAGDIRQAYLHYLLDPMVTRHLDKLEDKKALADYAQASPLPDFYKQDFLLLATKSLIRAIEARMERGAARKQAMVDEAMKEGFVLTAHFAEQLPLYEKQEQSMKFYFPELITSINLKREEKRLETFEFNSKRVERTAKSAPPPPVAEPSELEKSFEQAEGFYTARDLEKARDAFAAILTRTDQRPMQAKAYYGLGRVAALNRDPESAERLFQKSLELGAPPPEKAWTLVYLGKLSQAARQDAEASAHFQAALAVEGASAKAKEAASEGLRSISEKSKQ
jgi:TolA-binding protein